MLYPHTPDQGGEGTCPKEDAFQECRAGYPTNNRRTSFCRLCCKPTSKGQFVPFSGFYDILNQKGVSLAVNLSGIVVTGFLVLEQLLKFINDSLTLVEGNPDFSEIHFNDGVSVSLVVNGQTLLPGVAETRWVFKGHEHSQNGSDNVIIHFCSMFLLKHKITCCQ